MERSINQNTNCLNCGKETKGNFCSHCGQRTQLSEITIKEFLLALFRSFNLEKGVLFTAKQLSLRPGVAIREYIEGKRIRFTNPIKYLLLISALAAFINLYIPYEEIINIEIDGTEEDVKAFETSLLSSIELIYKQYFTLIMVLSIPIISFLTRIFFYKHKVSFAKNMVLNTYVSAQSLIIYLIVNIPLMIGLEDILPQLTVAYSLLMVLYAIIVFILFFKPKNIILAFIKGVFLHLIYYMVVTMLVGIVAFIMAFQQM